MKDKLLDTLRLALPIYHSFIGELTPTEIETIGTLERWSAKDTIAHITYWNSNFGGQIKAFHAQQPVPPYPTDDEADWLNQLNDTHFATHQHDAWDAVVEAMVIAIESVIQQFEQTPEAVLMDKSLAWSGGNSMFQAALNNVWHHAIGHFSGYCSQEGLLQRGENFHRKAIQVMAQVSDNNHGSRWYGLASFYARTQQTAQALETLPEAFRLFPRAKVWAGDDPDFDSLRALPEFQTLLL